jgi:UPF0716 protein FxsA
VPIGLFVALVLAPLIELALLITCGQWIGLWPVIGIVLATGVLGLLVLRLTGISALQRIMRGGEGEQLVPQMMDTTLLFGAGMLLVFPGLIGDALGLLLLLPPVRRLIMPAIWRPDRTSFRVYRRRTWKSAGPKPGDPPSNPTGPREPPESGTVIEGEFERLGERTVDPRRPHRPGT